ncbi:MBL fold metallo-hydrolase [Glaciecola sp. 1036]|uniref:MBL fold metallo-hydrolase n=1 Tax=Alteromonadaceae TaxID=72275 RepID=UPI003D051F9B
MIASVVMLVSMLSLSNVVLAQTYSIENVKDNVFRFTAGNYHSVFITTEEGTIVTDPISEDAAKHLRAYLREQNLLPITYMFYSHNHVDHVTGGEILSQDSTQVIAHKLAAQNIAFTKAPTRLVDITFTRNLTVNSGTTSVDLTYHGPNNGLGSVSYLIQPANVLYVVDWIVVGRMPYKDLIGYDITGMINSTKEVLATKDFDLFIGGHASMGTRQDIEHYLDYLETLYSAVKEGMLAGKTLPELQNSIKLDKFSNLKMYDEWLTYNIEGVYKSLINDSYFNFRQDLDTEF